MRWPTCPPRKPPHLSPAGTQGPAFLARNATSRHSARGQEQVLEELKINSVEPSRPRPRPVRPQRAGWAHTLYFWLFHEATGTCSGGRPGGRGGSQGRVHSRHPMTSSFLRFWIRKWPGEHLSPHLGTHPATPAKSGSAHDAHAPHACPTRSSGFTRPQAARTATCLHSSPTGPGTARTPPRGLGNPS